MNILRNAASVVAGIVAAGLCIAAIEAAAHSLAEGDTVFVAAVAGYGVGALVGSAIAARFGHRLCAAIVTGVLAVLAAINLFAFPHPIWFAPAAVVSLLAGWALGLRLIRSGPTARQNEQIP